MALFPILALVIACGALLVAVGAAVQVARSVPNALILAVRDAVARVEAMEVNVGGLQAKWVAKVEELEGILEALEGTLERVERKRASATSAAHRAERAQGLQAGAALTDRDAIKRRARELGILA